MNPDLYHRNGLFHSQPLSKIHRNTIFTLKSYFKRPEFCFYWPPRHVLADRASPIGDNILDRLAVIWYAYTLNSLPPWIVNLFVCYIRISFTSEFRSNYQSNYDVKEVVPNKQVHYPGGRLPRVLTYHIQVNCIPLMSIYALGSTSAVCFTPSPEHLPFKTSWLLLASSTKLLRLKDNSLWSDA